MHNETDFADYIAELKTPWKTMGPDMDTALSIITRHSSTTLDLDTVELISIAENEHETAISFPNWQSEIENVFIDQYGLNSGRQIFKKVVMRLFQLSKGTAQHLN